MPLLLAFVALWFAAPQKPADTSVGVVARLYHDFAWEVVIDEPRPNDDLLDQPRAVLERYFTGELATLLLQDRECAARTKEICKLDFDPIWDSQDPAAYQMKITDAGSGLVRVSYLYPGSGKKTELTFKTVKTAAGWRIADIRYHSGPSLATLLKSK